MKKAVEGVVEFKQLIKKLISKGISYYRLGKIFKIPATRIITLSKEDDKYPTLNDISSLEGIGYKAMVVIFKENDDETYRILQGINQNSFNEIEQYVIEEIKRIKEEKQKRLEEKMKAQEERRKKQSEKKQKEDQTVKELFNFDDLNTSTTSDIIEL